MYGILVKLRFVPSQFLHRSVNVRQGSVYQKTFMKLWKVVFRYIHSYLESAEWIFILQHPKHNFSVKCIASTNTTHFYTHSDLTPDATIRATIYYNALGKWQQSLTYLKFEYNSFANIALFSQEIKKKRKKIYYVHMQYDSKVCYQYVF